MKKAYVKPEIVFENFSMSQNIAADCEYQIDNPARGQCGIEFGPFTVFLGAVGSDCSGDGIMMDQGGDGEYNGLCYHVFTNNGEYNLFNS